MNTKRGQKDPLKNKLDMNILNLEHTSPTVIMFRPFSSPY